MREVDSNARGRELKWSDCQPQVDPGMESVRKLQRLKCIKAKVAPVRCFPPQAKQVLGLPLACCRLPVKVLDLSLGPLRVPGAVTEALPVMCIDQEGGAMRPVRRRSTAEGDPAPRQFSWNQTQLPGEFIPALAQDRLLQTFRFSLRIGIAPAVQTAVLEDPRDLFRLPPPTYHSSKLRR